MRTLALDYGERRVGVAISDPTGRTALPLETIERKRGAGDLFARLDALIAEYDVGQLVLGLPLSLDGSTGPQAERTRRFGRELERRTRLPVDYLDERWTSKEAERLLEPAGRSRRRQQKRRAAVDTVAATLLLQTWLARAAP